MDVMFLHMFVGLQKYPKISERILKNFLWGGRWGDGMIG